MAVPWPPNERQIKAKNYLQASSFRGDAQQRTRNLEILGSLVSLAPRNDDGVLCPRFQRLLEFYLEHAVDIFRRYRADQLVNDGAVAPDHKSLRHAIDAPFDRTAAVAVNADNAERIAVAAEEAPGIVGRVLVVDSDDLQPLVLAERSQQRGFVVARHAPGGPHIDDADLALEHGRIEPGHFYAVID